MIIIVDNGSQYSHLIKRGCRDLDYEAELINAKLPFPEIKEKINSAEKLILSGGPSSVFQERKDSSIMLTGKEIIEGKISLPVLGICYGHQIIAHAGGGKVVKGKSAEYGVSDIMVDEEDLILNGISKKFRAWVSHFDQVEEIPNGFTCLAHSDTCSVEAMKHKTRHIYGVQFHPEVWHTEDGEKILSNFLEI